MPIPKIDKENLKKPFCYDPILARFIYFDDIVSGRKKIIPLETLSAADLKKLVLERHRAGPDYRVRATSGPPMLRDDVLQAIEKDEPFGRMIVEVEAQILHDFLAMIQRNMEKEI
jgi:hypothetical protein